MLSQGDVRMKVQLEAFYLLHVRICETVEKNFTSSLDKENKPFSLERSETQKIT